MSQLVNSITVLLAAVVGVAILSVLVSRNSQTSQVITAGSQGFSGILSAAEAPVTGNSGGSLNLGSMGMGLPSYSYQ